MLIHESEFLQSNAVVVRGRAGVLLIDPGVQRYEMACLANDLRELGQPVVSGFFYASALGSRAWHARRHAALLIEERGVLVAGDILSDVLIPLLDLNDTADPIEDYLAGLRLLEGVAGDVDVFVPSHGSHRRS